MVFVEARLRSWGRAQTVITILDDNITNNDDFKECKLEDVIEAVRNCGDRHSSLTYLTQECEICFMYYPMHKVRSLRIIEDAVFMHYPMQKMPCLCIS